MSGSLLFLSVLVVALVVAKPHCKVQAVDSPKGDENTLADLLANPMYGPIAVTLNGENNEFYTYKAVQSVKSKEY